MLISISMQPPYLLVALPSMVDDYFSRTVVLVTTHDSAGASGYILNRPLVDEDSNPAHMMAEVKELAGNTVSEFSEELFDGGPAEEGRITALHDVPQAVASGDPGIGNGLYLTTDASIFQKLFEEPVTKHRRRFFLGASGWHAGQLDSEIRSGAWIMLPLMKQLLFRTVSTESTHSQEEYWKATLKASGLDPLTLMSSSGSDSAPN